MEKIGNLSMESIANYEGNDTLLLFERVKDPIIYEQILDLLCKGEESLRGQIQPIIGEDGRFKRDGEGNVLELPYVPKSRDQVKKELDEAIAREESSTEFEMSDYPYDSSTMHTMKTATVNPQSDRPFSEKQMSITEAHEKGHNIRYYDTSFHREHFRDAFRFDPQSITNEEVATFRRSLSEEDSKEPDDSIRDMYVHYLSSGMEIAERMSQLKNYFGMKGSDEFTKDHLEYAREHYIKDTGMDNGMAIFFRAITPETEEEFLRLINTSGI